MATTPWPKTMVTKRISCSSVGVAIADGGHGHHGEVDAVPEVPVPPLGACRATVLSLSMYTTGWFMPGL